MWFAWMYSSELVIQVHHTRKCSCIWAVKRPFKKVWSCSFFTHGFLAACFSFTMWAVAESEPWVSKIPWPDSPGLTFFFPKSVTVLEYSFSLSDPDSYKGYIEDLKPYDLEKWKNLTVCPDEVPFEQRSPIYVVCHVSYCLTSSMQCCGWSWVWLYQRKPLYSCENEQSNWIKASKRINYRIYFEGWKYSNCINLSSQWN